MTRRNVLRTIDVLPHGGNPGLWYDKFITQIDPKESGNASNAKNDLIVQLHSYKSTATDSYSRCYGQWERNIQAIPHSELYTAKTLGRCLVGLGGATVLETGLALQHTYGVPYIPGSALKGLAAAYAHQYAGVKWARGSAAHMLLFGTQDGAGVVDFLDAYWKPEVNQQPFAPDIMSVHQSKYYTGDTVAPSDRDSPNIVSFLSTARDLTFVIPLVGPAAWRDIAAHLLRDALRELGIGAKTNAGYGRMSIPVQLTAEQLQTAANIQYAQIAEAYIAQYIEPLGARDKGVLPGKVETFLASYDAGEYASSSAQAIAKAFLEKADSLKIASDKRWYLRLRDIIQEIR